MDPEVCERDGMYFHIFTDPKNPNVTVREVPFTLGKTYEQPVKNNMLIMMDYTYLAYEGDRTSLNTVYKKKPSPARPERQKPCCGVSSKSHGILMKTDMYR